MSSAIRRMERDKVRTLMKKEGVKKVNKGGKLRVWYNAYLDQKAQYLKKLMEQEQQNG